MSNKPAYVTGMKPSYQLCINPYRGAEAFNNLNWLTFPNYRAAQDIANAINQHVANNEAKAESMKAGKRGGLKWVEYTAKKEKKPCAKKQ